MFASFLAHKHTHLALQWVVVGFAFANEFETLLGYMEKGSGAMAAGLFLAGYWIWHRQKRNYEKRLHKKAA